MVLECQTCGPVESLHAISLGDLFDIRRAVWNIWGTDSMIRLVAAAGNGLRLGQ